MLLVAVVLLAWEKAYAPPHRALFLAPCPASFYYISVCVSSVYRLRSKSEFSNAASTAATALTASDVAAYFACVDGSVPKCYS